MTDNELVSAFRGGDKYACEELLNKYKHVVLRVARTFFLSGGDTEDLVQEGMCGLYSIEGCALEVPSPAVNPEDELIISESVTELSALMRRHLSPFEFKVMSMYVDGASMAEMCSALGKTYKSIDNAVSRSKRKLQKVIGG